MNNPLRSIGALWRPRAAREVSPIAVAEAAALEACNTQKVAVARSAKRSTMHNRLLGYVANRRPDRAEAISAQLQAASTLSQGRGA